MVLSSFGEDDMLWGAAQGIIQGRCEVGLIFYMSCDMKRGGLGLIRCPNVGIESSGVPVRECSLIWAITDLTYSPVCLT